ncbi:uncharacterized protein METZ01_LOCUS235345 [marine metagenome]|uniref:Uncharacterized protein n=1 Tax=marine metagenome TaxID=408172 RepID=A0A382H7U6_9ZZZZ
MASGLPSYIGLILFSENTEFAKNII